MESQPTSTIRDFMNKWLDSARAQPQFVIDTSETKMHRELSVHVVPATLDGEAVLLMTTDVSPTDRRVVDVVLSELKERYKPANVQSDGSVHFDEPITYYGTCEPRTMIARIDELGFIRRITSYRVTGTEFTDVLANVDQGQLIEMQASFQKP